MKHSIAVLVLLLSGATVWHAKDKICPSPEPVKDSKFRPGQVWRYKTRTGEEKSLLTILKVESVQKIGTIIHVRVDKVRLRNCTGGPEPDTIEHMPFTRDAIEHSITKIATEGSELPDYKAGYEQWHNDCGGVYTITVAEAIAIDEITFRQGLGCESMQSTR